MSGLPKDTAAALASTLGPIEKSAAVSGGDINDAFAVTLRSGDVVFVKTHPSPPDKMYEVEARGLRWLAETGVRTPAVLAVTDTFLALEYLTPSTTGTQATDDALGRDLARLHAHRDASCAWGWHHDGFIGPLLQSNRPATDWPTFYRDRRLVPLMRLATRRGVVGETLASRFDALCARLPALLGDAAGDRPSRLHGDLWGGNVHRSAAGPYFIDPAPYWGHREVDLAMMQLFGGFGERVFAAYDEALPREEGHEERADLYQLYPLLVHVCLFGATYVPGVARVVERYT